MLYNISICLSDIPQEFFQVATNGKTYVNLTVADKKEVDMYGYDASVSVNKTKEQNEADPAKIYCGRGKKIEFKPTSTPPATHPFPAQTPQGGSQSSNTNADGSPKDDLPF